MLSEVWLVEPEGEVQVLDETMRSLDRECRQ